MFIGRAYRKKRALSLLPVRAVSKARSVMSWRPPVHNAPGIERNWYETCFRSHAGCCGCGNFIAHLLTLADRYGFAGAAPPPGGPRPGPQAVRGAAPAGEPRPALPWHGGGGDGDGGAPGAAGGGGADGGDYQPEELDQLFAALEEDAQ